MRGNKTEGFGKSAVVAGIDRTGLSGEGREAGLPIRGADFLVRVPRGQIKLVVEQNFEPQQPDRVRIVEGFFERGYSGVHG